MLLPPLLARVLPGVGGVEMPPDVVLFLFLPALLYWESLTTSLRSIRRDFRYILPMSTLLVVASAFAVAISATAWAFAALSRPRDQGALGHVMPAIAVQAPADLGIN